PLHSAVWSMCPKKAARGSPDGLASGVFRTDMFVAASERVAQAVEHVTFNHGVEGSSPSALTIFNHIVSRLCSPISTFIELPFFCAGYAHMVRAVRRSILLNPLLFQARAA